MVFHFSPPGTNADHNCKSIVIFQKSRKERKANAVNVYERFDPCKKHIKNFTKTLLKTIMYKV